MSMILKRGSDLVPGQTVRLVFSDERFETVLHERLLKLISLDRADQTPRFLFRFGVDPAFELIEIPEHYQLHGDYSEEELG
jgi:hypothetical protein